MKKIILTSIFLVFGSISANAVDLSALSLTAGVAANTSLWGASGTEKEYDETGANFETNKEHGVFTDGFGSSFIELGLGNWVSVGYETVSDSISTPENQSKEHETGTKSKVSVDFNDFNTTYVKLNTPFGVYAKYGTVTTDLDVKETMRSGSTYKNVDTNGTSMGIGYQKFMGETGFGFRFESNYVELDSVKTDNGVAAGGNMNKIEVDNMEGLTAKIALTYTLGRN
jgi:hypothetical protein